DKLEGGSGDDLLYGGDDDDVLLGQSGNDFLSGGEEDDLIDGGFGQDTLEGGEGKDTFIMARNQGMDTILDFQVGTDVFGLSGGLEFAQLSFSQGVGSSEKDAFIGFVNTGELLASLTNFQADTLTSESFTNV
ncbi:MAG: hypothetical protein WA896_11085, partial [Spirulinaceae cyanobacterium]